MSQAKSTTTKTPRALRRTPLSKFKGDLDFMLHLGRAFKAHLDAGDDTQADKERRVLEAMAHHGWGMEQLAKSGEMRDMASAIFLTPQQRARTIAILEAVAEQDGAEVADLVKALRHDDVARARELREKAERQLALLAV